jgi:DNA-binding CsgD family transcriptional regulator
MDWQIIVQDFIQKNTDKIKKTTQPLHDHLGITYFTYHRIDQDGHYTVLVDRPDWAEYYVEKEFYKIDPFLRSPDFFESDICFMDEKGTAQVQAFVRKEYQNFFKSDPGLIFIEKSETFVEFFGFTGNYNLNQLKHLFSNDLYLLKKFTTYFKDELKAPLIEMQLAPNSLPELKGNDYFFKPLCLKNTDDQHHQFLCKIGLQEEIRWSENLTQRERQCLQHLLNGKNAKETAALLNLSPRTVEFYLENIKVKFNCSNKGEIFTKASSLKQLNLL